MTDLQSDPVDSKQIVDGEIIQDGSSNTNNDQATIITSLDELIKSHIASLDRLNEEKKKLQEMLADGLNNDTNYKSLSDKAKEASKSKSQSRLQIMNRPGITVVVNKLKNIVSEIKEKNLSLSDYLLEYQKMSGVNQIEGYDGEVREIVQVAKLIKKPS